MKLEDSPFEVLRENDIAVRIAFGHGLGHRKSKERDALPEAHAFIPETQSMARPEGPELRINGLSSLWDVVRR